jgi:hypothetical protein
VVFLQEKLLKKIFDFRKHSMTQAQIISAKQVVFIFLTPKKTPSNIAHNIGVRRSCLSVSEGNFPEGRNECSGAE